MSGRGGGIVLGLSGRKIAVWSLQKNYWRCDRIDSGLGSDVNFYIDGLYADANCFIRRS